MANTQGEAKISKGSNTSTTQSGSSVSPNPVAMQNYLDLLSRAQTVSNTPYTPFSGEEVAPINAQQNAGVGSINTAAAGFAPYSGQAGADISGAGTAVNANDINQYMDPYTSSVINATQADFDTQNKRAQSAVTGNAAAQGALGGNRVGVAQALTQEGQERVQAPVIAGLRSQGFQSAEQMANAQKARQLQAGSTLEAGALSGAQAQFGAGTAEQQTQQAQDTQRMTDYYTQQGYPFATAQWLAGITLGTGAQMGQTSTGTSTTQGPTPNTFGQAAGVGLAALSLFSDKRLKENIHEIGKLHDGQKVYRYNFKGDPTTRVGLISQEVEKHHPDAVKKVAGVGMVDYDAATEDAIKKWSGGAISGFADGGTPYGPNSQGWVPTIGKIGGATLHDPGVNPPKMGEQKQPDATGMGKSIGTIGKNLWDSFGSSSGGYDWDANPTGGQDMAGFDVTSGYASGGGIRRGFEDGGVPSFDDRFNGGDDSGVPVSLGFMGALEPSFSKRFGAGVPIDLPKSKGFEPTEDTAPAGATGVEPIPASDVPLPRGKPDTIGGVRSTMANEFSRAGGSPVAIQGLNMAVKDESNFDPGNVTPYDQHNPRFAGTEAQHAHGLFQEGGDEWNKYQSWLQKNAPDADWKDPALQTRFLAENLQANYPYVWANMVSAKTPGEAAAAFTSGYLKPAKQHEIARVNKYLGNDQGDNISPEQASYRPGVGGGTTDISARSRFPFVPGAGVASTEQPAGRMGGFNPLNLSDEARQGLISMGLGMMANRRGGPGSFLASVGEGGEQGMTTYASARAATLAQQQLAQKTSLEREKMMLPYSNMTANEKFNAQLNVQKALEATRAHNLAMRTPVKYYTDEDGVTHYAIPRPAPDGQVDFYPIDAKGNIASSPLGGSLKDAAQQNAPPALSQPAPQQGGAPGAPKLQQAAYNPDDGIVLANSKMEDSGQTFDYAKNTPVVEKGMYVPRPSPTANHSTQSIEADAERYLKTGYLPPTRSGMSPTAIAQQKYRTTIQNYAVAKAASMGMDAEAITAMQRTAPGMLRWMMNPQTGGTTVALGTAIRHLDTLDELARVWHAQNGSGDFITKNRLLGTLRREFGNDAITSLETAASIVGPEIIKAIGVAGGGTAEDRISASKQFGPMLAPGQLYGNIKTVEKLLAGQLEGKERQANNVGVSQEQFRNLIGERPYTLLKGLLDNEQSATTTGKTMSAPPQGSIPGKKDGKKVWKTPDGTFIPRE